MIQGVLGEQDPAREAVNVLGVVEGEEEGSSSTPEKEDEKDGKAVSDVQIFYSPVKRSAVPAITDALLDLAQAPPLDENLVVVEESVPERDARDPEALKPEEEARITPPLETSGRAPAFVQTLNDSSSYYERLRKKRAFPSVASPLSCEGHHSL